LLSQQNVDLLLDPDFVVGQVFATRLLKAANENAQWMQHITHFILTRGS
jgi:hypothetical protein